MKLVIAGYTAAPAAKADASIYYKQLATVKRAEGLGLSWKDGQTESDIAELLEVIPAHWMITLNAVPSTFQAWAKDHSFGLASPDENGRQSAVRMVRKIADTIKTINQKAGRQVILALEVQAAPGFSDRIFVSAVDAFAKSMREIAEFEWHGAEVLVEHCDAYVEGQKPAKGFLQLSEIIDVLKSLDSSPIKLSLNWGRSLIEVRDPYRVVDHVRQGSASGLLRAFTFSGTADRESACGVAWADSHLVFSDTPDKTYADPASLMTLKLAKESLEEIDDLGFLAVKTNWPAARTDPVERAASVIANFNVVVGLLDRLQTTNEAKKVAI